MTFERVGLDHHYALVIGQDAGQEVNEGGLAGTVRANDTGHSEDRYRQRNVVECLYPIKLLRYVDGLDSVVFAQLVARPIPAFGSRLLIGTLGWLAGSGVVLLVVVTACTSLPSPAVWRASAEPIARPTPPVESARQTLLVGMARISSLLQAKRMPSAPRKEPRIDAKPAQDNDGNQEHRFQKYELVRVYERCETSEQSTGKTRHHGGNHPYRQLVEHRPITKHRCRLLVFPDRLQHSDRKMKRLGTKRPQLLSIGNTAQSIRKSISPSNV